VLQKSIAALVLCLGLVCCASPAGVPQGANVEFDHLARSGLEWSWQRRVEHGCADFSTSDGSMAAVRLSVDPAQCGVGGRTLEACEGCGRGLIFFAENYMFFQNYWPWTREDSANGPIFNSNGMWIANRPCPHSLSPEQLATVRAVAREALAEATTDLERRTLERIDQILAATNGAALGSGQHGCVPTGARTSPVSERANLSPEDLLAPCDNLPAGATTTLPSPYDRYLRLACTQSGQMIVAAEGYRLMFETGSRWMWSTNLRSPAPSDHYTSLTLAPLSEAQTESLRRELREYTPRGPRPIFQPSLLERTTVRLLVQTSSGRRMQIYLFLPPEGSSQDLLGMECVGDCRSIRRDGYLFTMVPRS
jgi:hypothetical protein